MTLFSTERLLYAMQTNRLRPKRGDGGEVSDAGWTMPWAAVSREVTLSPGREESVGFVANGMTPAL